MKKRIESHKRVRLHRRISQDQRIGLKRFKASLNQPREKVVKRRPHLMRVQNQTQKVEGRMAMITKEAIPKMTVLKEMIPGQEEADQVQTYQLGTSRSTRFVERRMVRDTIQMTDAVLWPTPEEWKGATGALLVHGSRMHKGMVRST